MGPPRKRRFMQEKRRSLGSTGERRLSELGNAVGRINFELMNIKDPLIREKMEKEKARLQSEINKIIRRH